MGEDCAKACSHSRQTSHTQGETAPEQSRADAPCLAEQQLNPCRRMRAAIGARRRQRPLAVN